MSEETDESREFEATQHKIDEARKKGDLVRSADLSVAAAWGGLLAAALGFGAQSLERIGSDLRSLIDMPDRMTSGFFGGGNWLAGRLGLVLLGGLAPWVLLPILAVLLSLAAQRALVFAPQKLAFRLSRINPIANAKQRFGGSGLFEFGKGLTKLVLISALLAAFVSAHLPRLLLAQRMEAGPAAVEMLTLLVEFAVLIALFSGVMGGLDYLWQRAAFLRRQRMSRKELTDELKQSEGDPHIRQQRRQRAVEIASRQMIADVAKASVVIVNPTHYAVALKWERGVRRAPVCLAKGQDEIAARIRAVARENGVPVHRDPVTARSLYAVVKVGEEILPEHYRAVATAIRFAERIQRKARAGRGAGKPRDGRAP